jgi:SAM-dependent methyltransferase
MNKSHGPEYFRYLNERSSLRRYLRKLFLRPIVRAFSGRVLDIGSGIGEFLELYPDAIGIDMNPDCVASCLKKGLNCIEGSAYNLPFDAGFFDGVLLNNVLEHLERPGDALAEISRVLKRGGSLIIEVPGEKGFRYDNTHIKFWAKASLISFLEEHGFAAIRVNYFPFPFAVAGSLLTHNKLRAYAKSTDNMRLDHC